MGVSWKHQMKQFGKFWMAQPGKEILAPDVTIQNFWNLITLMLFNLLVVHLQVELHSLEVVFSISLIRASTHEGELSARIICDVALRFSDYL